MPNDLSVSAVSRPAPPSGAAAHDVPVKLPTAAAAQASGTQAEPAASGAKPAPASGAAAPVSLHSNPESWFDPAVGLVVLQFYDEKGVKTDSIPSQKQLDSYRLHDLQGGSAGATAAVGSPPSVEAS